MYLLQVLQTFGKADKSTDESFDELVQKTEKQQVTIKENGHCFNNFLCPVYGLLFVCMEGGGKAFC